MKKEDNTRLLKRREKREQRDKRKLEIQNILKMLYINVFSLKLRACHIANATISEFGITLNVDTKLHRRGGKKKKK
jgi:hypothetical protein